jgi:uncharacterized lipoprotein
MLIDEAMSRFDIMQADALTLIAPRQRAGTMTRTPLLIALCAAAALAGCNKEDHTIGSEDGDTNAAASNSPMTLPPSITASKSYRCKDNHLVYVDWMSDGSARVKSKRDEVGTPVTPGAELKGDAKASTITYNGQSCKA